MLFVGVAVLAVILVVKPTETKALIASINISPRSTQGILGGTTMTFNVSVSGDTVTGSANINVSTVPPALGTVSKQVWVGVGLSSFKVYYRPPAVSAAAPGTVVVFKVTEVKSGRTVDANITLTRNLGGNVCVIDTINPGPKGSCFLDTLRCAEAGAAKKCVPTRDRVAIGTWCSEFDHCDVKKVEFQYTCNEKNNYCVGAGRGVDCSDSAINTDPNLGKLVEDIARPERCDRGLVCQLDDNNVGQCVRDIGAEQATELGLGGSTEDIRDQIRRIINIALGFLGIIGVIIVIYGGFLWMSAMGEEDKVEKGKKTIIAGAIGLVIIGIAWTIVSYIISVSQGLK
ncbi:MAG TPA: hypothetical protein DDX47_00125 [Candidatus Jacksonbacteria bacterium]|nr:hypothetical protein [Candidatus Jacksonbacteria bacterium]HCR15087.1 hypothetical protein [Candidatus Jacksonbacteria bacterium]